MVYRLAPRVFRYTDSCYFALSLPSLVPPHLVPWAAAPVAYPLDPPLLMTSSDHRHALHEAHRMPSCWRFR